MLLEESERKGYINLQPGWCWGAACRPIKTSSGGLTNTPSNHSWGLAIDINAPENPFGGSSHTIPVAMGDLWGDYGFRWGGFYSSVKDWMHFEFLGSVDDAATETQKAIENGLGGGGEDELDEEQEKLLKYLKGFKKFFDGGPQPAEAGPVREGWRDAEKTVTLPKQEATPDE